MVANRRFGGIVNRHKKTLNLPEIPVPPRLPVFLKLLAFLAAVTVLLLPFGSSCAGFFTQNRLRAAGLVPETVHNFNRTDVWFPRTETCDAQQCHEECTVQHTLLDECKGRITGRNCTSTDVKTTNASLAATVRWNCSFDYAVNEAPPPWHHSQCEVTLQWHWGACASLFLAVLEVPAALLVLRANRCDAEEYVAATRRRRRDRILTYHEELRKLIVIIFSYVVFYGSLALYGMTLQSFSAVSVYTLFLHLLGASIAIGVLSLIAIIAVCSCFACFFSDMIDAQLLR